MYCTVLYCTVLYCTVLYCTVLYCTVLYGTVCSDGRTPVSPLSAGRPSLASHWLSRPILRLPLVDWQTSRLCDWSGRGRPNCLHWQTLLSPQDLPRPEPRHRHFPLLHIQISCQMSEKLFRFYQEF